MFSMEYIKIDEKTFVKASKIARELGYTADYIGQLCRAGKVEAQLVGRSWYVEETSIRLHKRDRYRRTKAKTQKELHQAVNDTYAKSTTAPVRSVHTIHQPPLPGGKFYRHHQPTLVAPRYVEDDTELLPIPKKPVRGETTPPPKYITIELAEADKIAVTNHDTETQFTPTELPELHFKGRVEVVSAEDIVDSMSEVVPVSAEEETVPMVSKQVSKPVVHVSEIATEPASHQVPVLLDDKKRGEKIPVAVLKSTLPPRPKKGSKKQYLPVTEDEGARTKVVVIHESTSDQEVDASEVQSMLVPLLIFFAVTTTSVFIGLCILSIQGVVEIDQETITTRYEFDIWLGIEQIKLYIHSYLG